MNIPEVGAEENNSTRFEEDSYRKSVKEIFDSIDKDGDGYVGVNELMNYLTGTRYLIFSYWVQTKQRRGHKDGRRC